MRDQIGDEAVDLGIQLGLLAFVDRHQSNRLLHIHGGDRLGRGEVQLGRGCGVALGRHERLKILLLQ